MQEIFAVAFGAALLVGIVVAPFYFGGQALGLIDTANDKREKDCRALRGRIGKNSRGDPVCRTSIDGASVFLPAEVGEERFERPDPEMVQACHRATGVLRDVSEIAGDGISNRWECFGLIGTRRLRLDDNGGRGYGTTELRRLRTCVQRGGRITQAYSSIKDDFLECNKPGRGR